MTRSRDVFVRLLAEEARRDPLGFPSEVRQKLSEMLDEVPPESAFWDHFLGLLTDLEPLPVWASLLVVWHIRLERRVTQLLVALGESPPRMYGRKVEKLKRKLPQAFGPGHAHGAAAAKALTDARNDVAHGLKGYDEILGSLRAYAEGEIAADRATPGEINLTNPGALVFWLAARAVGWVARCNDHHQGIRPFSE